MGILSESEWYGRFVGQARPIGATLGTPLPFPWLRKTLDLKQKPQQAFAYVNALGYYELYVNGKKVDDYVLAPAVSDYSKRTVYVTHDITDYLTPGKNSIALWLGRGWYVKGHPGVIHDGPLVRAQFDIRLSDGSAVKLGTDETWKVRPSPITPLGRGMAFGDYGGEHYDAGMEVEGWNTAALDDSKWEAAAVFEPPHTITAAQMVEPNRVVETLKPAKIEENPAGAWLVDMGKNYVGWLELNLPPGTAAGANIKIEYADWTPTPGRWATFNQRDEYVTRAGAQTIRSRFNYHGFRYAHVTGLNQAPSAADVKGSAIRTGYDRASEFESSNELLNQIYRTVTWTYQCLSLGGYVVDCPTRERLGYGGDSGTSIETGMINFDSGGLYNRWSDIWRDAQDPATGDLPYTAPNYPDQGGGGPMWSGFMVTMPWQIYLQYGDRRALEKNYPAIQKWLAFAESKTVDHILEPYISIGIRQAQWNYLGDWVTPRREGVTGDPARDPVGARFINNCHYLYELQIAAKIAAILDKNQDAAMYQQRAATLSRVLQEKFYDPAKGIYATGEQPYLALALLLHVTPPELREPVMKRLEQTILVKNQGHIDAGMHGTYFLLKELMAEDRNDLIFTMANQTTYPGWGDMLRQGATTIWENWSGGSHIHDCLISIGTWFVEGIGGIRIDENAPGFRHFIVKPGVVGGLTFARARYKSIYGWISSDWRIENGALHLEVTVPPGTTATVYTGKGSVEVGSGHHVFTGR
jgi:alpha-L-rhamnosidase